MLKWSHRFGMGGDVPFSFPCRLSVCFLLTALCLHCQEFFSDTLKVRIFSLTEGKRTCETRGLEGERIRGKAEGSGRWMLMTNKGKCKRPEKDKFELLQVLSQYPDKADTKVTGTPLPASVSMTTPSAVSERQATDGQTWCFRSAKRGIAAQITSSFVNIVRLMSPFRVLITVPCLVHGKFHDLC